MIVPLIRVGSSGHIQKYESSDSERRTLAYRVPRRERVHVSRSRIFLADIYRCAAAGLNGANNYQYYVGGQVRYDARSI